MWSFYVWKMKFSKFIIGFPKKKKFILFASAISVYLSQKLNRCFLNVNLKVNFGY